MEESLTNIVNNNEPLLKNEYRFRDFVADLCVLSGFVSGYVLHITSDYETITGVMVGGVSYVGGVGSLGYIASLLIRGINKSTYF